MPSNILKIFRPATVGGLYLFRFIIKHWYFFIILLVILPSITSSISQAVEQKNPSLPFFQLGIRLTNADALISKDVDTLKENPEELIGLPKPEIGIWRHVVYYWNVFKVFWMFLGNIFLISVPFIFFHKILHRADTSKQWKMLFIAIILSLLFIFVINLVILSHGLIKGNSLLVIPENMGFFDETWFIIKNTLPFHGLFKLGAYLIGLI